MKTQEAIKYAGAGQIAREYTLSPLGVKVANVLGQVGRGIYHYDSDFSGRNKPQWNHDRSITAVLSREIATFDGCELTVLVLCCNAAGLKVKLSGRTHGYLAIEFSEGQKGIPGCALFPCNEAISIEEFAVASGLGERSKRRTTVPYLGETFQDFLFKRERDRYYSNGRLNQLSLSVSNDHPIDLGALVVAAHQACIRVAIRGLTHQSIEVWLSKRENRDGQFWQRHPDWSTACEMLKPVYSIDFESLE